MLQFGLPGLATPFPSPRIAEAAAPWRPCASGPLMTGGYREPSLVFLTETGTRLALPAEIAEALREDPGTLLLLEDRWRPFVADALGAPVESLDLVERATLRYFNYNRGGLETARLITPRAPRWEACE